jgi:hypothetical protein
MAPGDRIIRGIFRFRGLPKHKQKEIDHHDTQTHCQQKIASQAGRTLQQLKARKYFTYRIDGAGILQWERKQDTIAAETDTTAGISSTPT